MCYDTTPSQTYLYQISIYPIIPHWVGFVTNYSHGGAFYISSLPAHIHLLISTPMSKGYCAFCYYISPTAGQTITADSAAPRQIAPLHNTERDTHKTRRRCGSSWQHSHHIRSLHLHIIFSFFSNRPYSTGVCKGGISLRKGILWGGHLLLLQSSVCVAGQQSVLACGLDGCDCDCMMWS